MVRCQDGAERTYYITADYYRQAVKDRMDYSEVVIAALEQYLGVRSSATKKKGRDGAKP